MRLLPYVPITILMAMGCGCSHARRTDFDLTQLSAAATQVPAESLWQAIQDTLRYRGYRLDRVDREAGVVTTLPESSQHYFEFWRKDVDTRADFWEATMNPIRRWVEVQVGHPTGAQQITVIVHKEQFSSLDRQFNSTGAAFQLFAGTLPATTGQERITPADEQWLDHGRDPAMEQYLLSAILEQAGSHPG